MAVRRDFLEGYDVHPWFTEPAYFPILVYPMEWKSSFTPTGRTMREALPMFYSRLFEAERVMCLPTLAFVSLHEDWFSDSLSMGLKEFVNNNPDTDIFPSDCYSMLWDGKLVEIPENRKRVKEYVMVPLWPSAIALPSNKVRLSLGLPLGPGDSIPAMKSIVEPRAVSS